MIIVEGFDCVGKDTYVAKTFRDMLVYRPDYNLFDSFFTRNDAWVIGYSIFDYLSQTNTSSDSIVLNRGIASSLVYAKLYNIDSQILKETNLLELLKWWKSNRVFKDSTIIHIYHSSKESAEILYNSMVSSRVMEDLDKFESFDDYWRMYLKAEELYKDAYHLLGVTPVMIPSVATLSHTEGN